LVSFEGEVKIIDFGLAKSTQRSQETQANVLLGNFGYMSPEQARGHQLDVRTDVYSAGIVLFELVTGTKRFVEENPLRLLEMVARPTPIVPSDRVPGTPKTIDKIYSKATAPAKEERFDSAEAFRDDVTTALHKINPKASRENLAQFLNHLFLGGAPPAQVDADALDKSVAVRVRDLYERSDAFQAPSESDIKDRRLTEFSDDAPQTASHPLMRQARAGDVLTHQQLTGDESTPPQAVQVNVAAAAAAAADRAKSQPPHSQLQMPLHTTDATMPNPMAARGNAAAAPPPAMTEELEEHDLVVDLGEPMGTPTSVYDSPDWPNQLDRAAADSGDASADVMRQIEEQARMMEAQAAAEKAAAEKAAAEKALHERAMAAKQAAAAEKAAAERAAPAEKGVVRHPPDGQSGVHRAPNLSGLQQTPAPAQAPPTTRTTVVTTVGPPPKRPTVSQEQQPSIVIAMDLEPGEPTVVGAQMPSPKPPPPQHDNTRTVEVQPVSAQDKAKSGGGFGDGGVHESLIIDFEGEAEAQPAQGNDPQPDKAIRPAAQPLGRRVQAAVAQPKRPTTRTGPAPGADESPGNTMPPPTRRRS
jgi:hypothetical protein